jgi:hypothetical protein
VYAEYFPSSQLRTPEGEILVTQTKEKENKKPRRRRRCACCNQLKFDVVNQINPYVQDIQGIEQVELLCTECVNNLVADI